MKIKLIKRNKTIVDNSDLKKIELAELYLSDSYHLFASDKTKLEVSKKPYRYDIINYILKKLNRKTVYLEIGVRNPDDNFNKILAEEKYSVDPGLEHAENNVDFKVTSDEFFQKLDAGEYPNKNIKFDAIFIDGLHLADQVERDINNSLRYLQDDGFIIMHDCNPPTEFHASENYYYRLSPSQGYWNGTTWKAFFKARKRKDIFSCCIDTDWGVGIISKQINIGESSEVDNEFYEYHILNDNRKSSLNLISFDDFKSLF